MSVQLYFYMPTTFTNKCFKEDECNGNYYANKIVEFMETYETVNELKTEYENYKKHTY